MLHCTHTSHSNSVGRLAVKMFVWQEIVHFVWSFIIRFSCFFWTNIGGDEETRSHVPSLHYAVTRRVKIWLMEKTWGLGCKKRSGAWYQTCCFPFSPLKSEHSRITGMFESRPQSNPPKSHSTALEITSQDPKTHLSLCLSLLNMDLKSSKTPGVQEA